MWTGTLASPSPQAAVWLNSPVTADRRDSSGLLLGLPLSGAGWALLWYFTLRAWLSIPADSPTGLYRCMLFTTGMPNCVSVGHFLSLNEDIF